MSEDELSWRYWHLAAHMSEVIKAHKYLTDQVGPVGTVTVRWDSDIPNGTRIPTDIFSQRLLECLKEFEFAFIKLRLIDPRTLQGFIDYCKKERRHVVKKLQLNNFNPGTLLSECFVECTIQVDDFTFKYWNNDYLPHMSISVID